MTIDKTKNTEKQKAVGVQVEPIVRFGNRMTKLKQMGCGLIGHSWSSAAMQGLKPTSAQINSGIDGFFDYATMYCKRCGYASKLSKNMRN